MSGLFPPRGCGISSPRPADKWVLAPAGLAAEGLVPVMRDVNGNRRLAMVEA